MIKKINIYIILFISYFSLILNNCLALEEAELAKPKEIDESVHTISSDTIRTLDGLKNSIEKVLNSIVMKSAKMSVAVYSLDKKEFYYTRNADLPLIPASNTKLVTTFLSLENLTKDYKIKTQIYTDANYKEQWSFAIDISAMGMFIPDGQKAYNAELPPYYDQYDYIRTSENRNGTLRTNIGLKTSQPTIYGGTSTALFAAPRSHYTSHLYTMPNGETISLPDTLMFKTISFVEGNQISFMAGLPALQLVIGVPTCTEFRFRCFFYPIQDETLNYIGLMASQRIDHCFDWFKNDPFIGLSLNLSYHNIYRTHAININSWSLGAHFSKGWDNGLIAYCGIQYEGMNGSLTLTRSAMQPGEQIDSPYPEIRFGEPLHINAETFTNFRLLGGLSYRYSLIEIHADAGIASQPILTAGITFWIAQFGKDENGKKFVH